MITLYWENNKFQTQQKPVLDIENLHWYSLRNGANKIRIVSFLRQCDFDLIDYIFYPDNQFKIVKSSECCIPVEDEGTGFNILFHLCGYILIGRDLTIVESSIKPLLHPVLCEAIKEALTNTEDCAWLSPKDVRSYLKCAMNPSGDCGDCQHFESDKKQIIKFI